HFPATQKVPLPQAAPQAPQLAASVIRFAQVPLHWLVPLGHEVAQAPLTQTPAAAHAVPHAPQLRGSGEASTHSSPHWGLGQVSPQPATRPAIPTSPTISARPYVMGSSFVSGTGDTRHQTPATNLAAVWGRQMSRLFRFDKWREPPRGLNENS